MNRRREAYGILELLAQELCLVRQQLDYNRQRNMEPDFAKNNQSRSTHWKVATQYYSQARHKVGGPIRWLRGNCESEARWIIGEGAGILTAMYTDICGTLAERSEAGDPACRIDKAVEASVRVGDMTAELRKEIIELLDSWRQDDDDTQ